jgi:hypothetical protein
MNARVLLPCVFLCGGFVVFELACQAPSPYPPLYDQVYEAGIGTRVTGGGGPTDATEPEDGSASEDASGDDSGTITVAATCPTGSTLFANADGPQAISLDKTNAYWANGAFGGSGVGSIGYLARASKSGKANPLVAGLDSPVYVANAGGVIAWSALGGGVGEGTVSSLTLSGTSKMPGSALTGPEGVAVDQSNVYWASDGTTGVLIQSAPVAGDTPITVGSTTDDNQAGGLSVQAGNLYFAGYSSGGGGAIYEVPIGGGTPKTLQTFPVGEPKDVVTDAANVYWTDLLAGGGSVFSMPLGGGTVTTMAAGLGSPNFMAIDSTNAYTADYTSGSVYEIPLGSVGKAKVLVTAVKPVGVAADDAASVVYFTELGAICTVAK